MRIFLSVEIPNTQGNEAIKSGSMPRVMKDFMEKHRPEAAYFITSTNGNRNAHFYLDLKDVSYMPVIAEPFFSELGAKIVWCPAMNADDLKKGLEMLGSASAVGAR